MCGICGFTKAAQTEGDFATLEKMCEVMAHRGPDGEGRRIADGVALGHRRLSLIDLAGGAQPMVRSENGEARWCIVFNGEIYNYRELRVELEQLGFAFETNSDTEVLLVGYIAWGADVLLHGARRPVHLRVGDQVDPRAPGLRARAQRGGARPIPVLPVLGAARDVLQRRVQVASRPLPAGAQRLAP